MNAVVARQSWALLLIAGLALLGNQPCGPIPGETLEGPTVAEPVADWSFVDEHSRCQLEVNPREPHSITVYCFAGEGVLYVPAVMGESKKWTKLAVANSEARIRIGGRIYPVTIARIEGSTERFEAAVIGHRNFNDGEDVPDDFEVPEDRWYFRLTSR